MGRLPGLPGDSFPSPRHAHWEAPHQQFSLPRSRITDTLFRVNSSKNLSESLLCRFLDYVRIDTQSNSESKTVPSTKGQWNLLRRLRRELRQFGADDIYLGPQGHLMAAIPATVRGSRIPTVAFMAHVDTAPDFSGADVKPIVHRQWKGKAIRLPDDATRVLDPRQDAELKKAVGKTIITASGKTLLGADDKAGVAILMTLADHLLRHPDIPHGPIRFCFLPDEEVGLRGAASLDLGRLGANLGYTLDGQGLGEVVWESFSGDSAKVTIQGVATHPGEARARHMVNAVHLAGKLLAALPREFVSPETTENYQGYLHPVEINGNAARTSINFILRDFNDPGLADKKRRLAGLCRGLQATEPRAKFQTEFSVGYRNMAETLRLDRRPVDLAVEAMRRVGLQPLSPPVRGGTDGSNLSQRGLPTPNLSNGSHNAHGPLEWVALEDMEIMLKGCCEIVQLWAQKGAGFRGYQPRRR